MGTLHYFKSSFIVAIIGVVLGYFIGGWPAAFSVAVLAVLETSLSVDNAVVNAKKLETMSPFWRQMFITVGMPIAVFGMRLLFPLLIVALVSKLDMFPNIVIWIQNLFGSNVPMNANVLDMAIHDPKQYETILTSAHYSIAGFGGAFLLLVCLKFFIDAEKDTHWLSWIEKPLGRLGKVESLQIAIVIGTLYIISSYLTAQHSTDFFTSGILGILTYVLVDGLGALLEIGEDGGASATTAVAKSGLAGFIYLEVLDASFSFDGVIGAFAVSNHIFIIMIGLGVGAMVVRSATIMLVERGTLAEFSFLEHGAFYAIGSLAAIMLLGTIVHIPDVVAGFIGVIWIAIAVWASIYHKKHENDVEVTLTIHPEDHVSMEALKATPFYKSHK